MLSETRRKSKGMKSSISKHWEEGKKLDQLSVQAMPTIWFIPLHLQHSKDQIFR